MSCESNPFLKMVESSIDSYQAEVKRLAERDLEALAKGQKLLNYDLRWFGRYLSRDVESRLSIRRRNGHSR